MKIVIAGSCYTRQSALLCTSQKSNSLRDINEWFVMWCKSFTAIMFTVVGPPPKINWTVMAVPETPLRKFLSIRQPPIAVTPICTIILPYLQFNFLQSRMSNSSSRSSINRDIRYCADIWIVRRRTGIVEALTGRHIAFVINVIKGSYVLFWRLCVCCESIIEAISSDVFR